MAPHILIVAALMVTWAPVVAVILFRDRRAGAEDCPEPPTAPSRVDIGLPAQTAATAWSELDDRQLTRLLMESAPRTTTD
jgi:hypothetical protein